MNKPLDELYLNWLYQFIGDPELPKGSRTHWKLARALFTKEFVWFIPNDDNRVQDGQYLRNEFIEDLELEDVDPDWLELGCSMLELLVGLSQRLSFLDEGEPRDWFWTLIDNLDLRCHDRGPFPKSKVEEVLDNVIWRRYDRNGYGGLFPLRRPNRDQRKVELWFQLNEYLNER